MIRVGPRVSLLVVWGLIGILAGPSVAQEELSDVIDRCERAVVRIEVETVDGNHGIGSGFVVEPSGVLVTNVHVLRGARRAVAFFPDGSPHEIVGTLSISEPRDICVARLEGSGFPVLTLAADVPRKGESVTALGSPRGLSFSASTGIVSAIRPAKELGPDIGRPEIEGTWLQVDAALSPGNSGGPLINSRGEVVGMSTLASQGSAQNLNFGISASDIREIVTRAEGTNPTSLADGIAKLQKSELPVSDDTTIIDRRPVPQERLQEFVSAGREDFKKLLAGLRTEIARCSASAKEMRKGETFLPPGAQGEAEIVRLITRIRNKNHIKYFFRSQGVKDREINRLQSRIDDLEKIRDSATDPNDSSAIFALLAHYGPRLDPRREGSIGFIPDAVVAHSYNEHDVVIHFEDTPFLLWLESTAGLAGGSELIPAPVYVAGTETIQPPGKTPVSVTMLYTVTDAELRAAVFGSATANVGHWRTWKDSTGKHQIEAQLIEVSDGNVRLKKRDGSMMIVPISRLSPEDLEHLGLR